MRGTEEQKHCLAITDLWVKSEGLLKVRGTRRNMAAEKAHLGFKPTGAELNQ
jgi:hypothetical protein